jgi:hypothetical protein
MIEKLKAQLAKLRRMQFGQSSEKLDAAIFQLELALEDVEEGTAARTVLERAVMPAAPDARQSPVRRPLPDRLPLDDVFVALKDGIPPRSRKIQTVPTPALVPRSATSLSLISAMVMSSLSAIQAKIASRWASSFDPARHGCTRACLPRMAHPDDGGRDAHAEPRRSRARRKRPLQRRVNHPIP